MPLLSEQRPPYSYGFMFVHVLRLARIGILIALPLAALFMLPFGNLPKARHQVPLILLLFPAALVLLALPFFLFRLCILAGNIELRFAGRFVVSEGLVQDLVQLEAPGGWNQSFAAVLHFQSGRALRVVAMPADEVERLRRDLIELKGSPEGA